MSRLGRRVLLPLTLAGSMQAVLAQQVYTWEQIREKFRATNPTIQAAEMSVSESRANEITAYLRPNPTFNALIDQFDPITYNPYRPLANLLPAITFSYLHEREHKRELRRDSARKATEIAESTLADQERSLLFNLRNAFVQTLLAKAVLGVAKESLGYYDHLLDVSRERLRAGDIANIDLDRLELQRAQFASDVITATTNLNSAKIQLRALLNERTAIDQFDIAGPFDFAGQLPPLDDFRAQALENRPDLRVAMQAIEKARTDHQLAVANGSTDPTFAVDFGRNPPIAGYMGFSLNIPLRIFDRNQGAKAQTAIEITRTERLRAAAEAQVYSDVDSAYNSLGSNLDLLKLYKSDYLQRAVRVRETESFAYQRGGASLLDFLQSQQDYRMIQLTYVNLIGAYLAAASQMNLAVGKEVLP